jgi:hypothetical protein
MSKVSPVGTGSVFANRPASQTASSELCSNRSSHHLKLGHRNPTVGKSALQKRRDAVGLAAFFRATVHLFRPECRFRPYSVAKPP